MSEDKAYHMEPGICVAAMSGHGWSARFHQCEKKAKHEVLVQPSGYDKGGEPFTVSLCGIHKNIAERGRGLSILNGKVSSHWSGGPSTTSVVGIASAVNELRAEHARAKRDAEWVKQSLGHAASMLGHAIVDEPDLMEYLMDSQVGELVRVYQAKRVDYTKKKAAEANALQRVEDATNGQA